jgi:hypothetical protein
MSELLVLRFRDLVTEPGGTITEHRRVLEEQGTVWWGWWMRQNETPPMALFSVLFGRFESGEEVPAYLFDSGRELLHSCVVSSLRVAQPGETLGPPSLEQTPDYYHRGKYPAWFQLSDISADGAHDVPQRWRYAAFPTRPDEVAGAHVGDFVESLAQLRTTDATMWQMETP